LYFDGVVAALIWLMWKSPLSSACYCPSAVRYRTHVCSCHAINIGLLSHIRGLLEKYPTFGREKETGLLGALDT